MRNPCASTKPSRNPAAIATAPYFSDVADVRQHLLAEQFERFHQLVGIFRARGLEKQIDDAVADLAPRRPDAGLASDAERIHRRQRLLQRLWARRHGGVMEMPALPAEGLRLLPGTQYQLHALIGALARFLGVEVIGQHLVG